ncbi:MAG TPA: helix-turn-helix transcriptional regulator [Trichormus sp.]|jgi:transcriptional regulator with XRE-family HTH domain
MKQKISLVLGEVLTEARLRKGLSQNQLARLSGMHRSYIGDLERGARNISIENFTALAAAFGVSGSVLLRRMERLQESPARKRRIG